MLWEERLEWQQLWSELWYGKRYITVTLSNSQSLFGDRVLESAKMGARKKSSDDKQLGSDFGGLMLLLWTGHAAVSKFSTGALGSTLWMWCVLVQRRQPSSVICLQLERVPAFWCSSCAAHKHCRATVPPIGSMTATPPQPVHGAFHRLIAFLRDRGVLSAGITYLLNVDVCYLKKTHENVNVLVSECCLADDIWCSCFFAFWFMRRKVKSPPKDPSGYFIHKCIHWIIYFSHIPTAQLPVAVDHGCVPSLRHALHSGRTGISINNRENIKY